MRAWGEADDGEPVHNLNLMRYSTQLRPLPGVSLSASSIPQANALYEKAVGPMRLKRGVSIPFAGNARGVQSGAKPSGNLISYSPSRQLGPRTAGALPDLARRAPDQDRTKGIHIKAVVCQNTELALTELPTLAPGPGQVRLKILRCGICGSDLHMHRHCDHMHSLMERLNWGREFPHAADPVVFGHELYPELAALTEPMAVAHHTVRRGEVARKDTAIVIGRGPVGLAVICLPKARGVERIVASDFSAGRRKLAERCGADVVIDPALDGPFAPRIGEDFIRDFPALLELSLGTREKLGKLPVPWHVAWRLAEKLGALPQRPVIFECVGVPGILHQIIDGAPPLSDIVVAGVCMQVDRFEPALAIHKEIDLRFVFGHSPLEYRDTLHLIAEGKVDCAPLLTGMVGLEGVATAFDALRNPETHAKILIDPARGGDALARIGA